MYLEIDVCTILKQSINFHHYHYLDINITLPLRLIVFTLFTSHVWLMSQWNKNDNGVHFYHFSYDSNEEHCVHHFHLWGCVFLTYVGYCVHCWVVHSRPLDLCILSRTSEDGTAERGVQSSERVRIYLRFP